MREIVRRDLARGLPAGESGLSDQRHAPRFTVLIRAAKLIGPAGEYLCVIRDVSDTGISIRIFHELAETGPLLIELQNGDQCEAELVWQDEDRAGLRFCEKVDIARIVEVPSRFTKRAIRLNLSAPAEVICGLQILPVTIHDISQQGAKIASQQHFAIDQRIKLRAKGLRETEAKIRWRRDGMCGLIFEETFQFGELARIVQTLQHTPA